ncbi:hypothetical protein [Flocculibacter collagenilyticus]|uniref:hypothetical protein n=1 Tax=Flocculibacter collagenilyticus TaxID=2744479 RepID=UPI0018F3B46F|nr:hypothetical protein [Flocculibacter collagenilyticus]
MHLRKHNILARLSIKTLATITAIALSSSLNASELEKNYLTLQEAGVLLAEDKDALILNKMPSQFPIQDWGKDVSVFGSYKRAKFQGATILILKSSKNKALLKQAVIHTLEANQWSNLHLLQHVNPTGFITNQPEPNITNQRTSNRNAPFCHKKDGFMQISTHDLSNSESMLTITHHPLYAICSIQQAERKNIIMAKDLPYPTLSLPDNIETPFLPYGAGSSSGGNNIRKSTELFIDTTMPLDRLYQHFVSQMNQQGWAEDSNWSGSLSEGGVWTIADEQFQKVFGNISITRFSAEKLYIKLEVQGLNEK